MFDALLLSLTTLVHQGSSLVTAPRIHVGLSTLCCEPHVGCAHPDNDAGTFHMIFSSSCMGLGTSCVLHHKALRASIAQVRASDVEMLAGSPEGQPLATAARRWAAFDGSSGALHQLSNSDDYVSVQLHGAGRLLWPPAAAVRFWWMRMPGR